MSNRSPADLARLDQHIARLHSAFDMLVQNARTALERGHDPTTVLPQLIAELGEMASQDTAVHLLAAAVLRRAQRGMDAP